VWGHIRVHNLNGQSDEFTKSLRIKTKSYLCVGAVVFQKIEGQPEIDRRKDLKAQINTFLGKNL
jgi:hypothetical protein